MKKFKDVIKNDIQLDKELHEIFSKASPVYIVRLHNSWNVRLYRAENKETAVRFSTYVSPSSFAYSIGKDILDFLIREEDDIKRTEQMLKALHASTVNFRAATIKEDELNEMAEEEDIYDKRSMLKEIEENSRVIVRW